MELVVEGQSVLLTTHKTYGEMPELDCLRAVARYPPLLAFLQRCANSGTLPTAVVVRRLHRVAHRIHGAVVDVLYEDAATHTTRVHALGLTTDRPALLMPVVVVGGTQLALLARQSTLSQGLCPVAAGIRGTVSEAGQFEASAKLSASLQALGVDCTKSQLITPHAFTIGNEGEPPVHLFSLTLRWDDTTAQEAEATSHVVLMPLVDVLQSHDAGAALCASLLLQ